MLGPTIAGVGALLLVLQKLFNRSSDKKIDELHKIHLGRYALDDEGRPLWYSQPEQLELQREAVEDGKLILAELTKLNNR